MKKVLDIGTGSGCIAISLSKNRPSWEVFATDISVKALEVATENAKQIGAKVFFKNHDILSKEINFGPFDIIVSNPPYVRVSEKKLMQRNVLDNEPGIALFVADDYPLVFYAAIAECAKDSLVQNGAIYCEINEALCNDTVAVFQNVGFFNVEVRKDIHGKDRMICAKRE
jgi:release factor glutamine methyltransferase